MKILFADNWHFHRRNFLPLFEAIQQDSLPHLFETSRSSWWKAHGHYSTHEKLLTNSLYYVDQHQDWAQINYQGINLWGICKAEFLCNALAQDRWHIGGIPNESEAVFKYAVANEGDRAALRLCLAAANDWLIFWSQYLDRHTDISHGIVFSGSYIYTRALMALAKQKNISVLVAEHFFTGNDFYLEYRLTPIANNEGLVRKEYSSSFETPSYNAIASAYCHERIKNMRNRNTPKQNIPFGRPWDNQNPVILITGQVVNDFSIIETPSDELSSIARYKQILIELLRKTNANLIFKAHPWERKRAPLYSPLTKIKIEEFIQSLPAIDRARIVVIENEPIQEIFQSCDGVMGISSQGLLESCQFGFKPVLLGKTFYSHSGFTQDINESSGLLADTFNKSSWRLSLGEYQKYENFMQSIFTRTLIPNKVIASSLVTKLLHGSQIPLPLKFMLTILNTYKIHYANLIIDICERPLIWIKNGAVWMRTLFVSS